LKENCFFYLICFSLTVLGSAFLTMIYAISQVELIELKITFGIVALLISYVAYTAVMTIRDMVYFE